MNPLGMHVMYLCTSHSDEPPWHACERSLVLVSRCGGLVQHGSDFCGVKPLITVVVRDGVVVVVHGGVGGGGGGEWW
jgi:hypothetical protein